MDEIIELLLSYLRGIWRRRWYAIGVAWAIAISGWVFVHQLPDQYEASARLHIDTRSLTRYLMRGLAVDMGIDKRVQLMTRTFFSRDNLEKIARATDLDLRATTQAEFDRLLDDLKRRLNLSGRGEIYTIGFNDEDARMAQRVVQAVLTIFVETSLGETRMDADSAARFLEKQLSEYESRLLAAEKQLAEFQQENLVTRMGSQQEFYSKLVETRDELRSVELTQREAENRHQEIQQQRIEFADEFADMMSMSGTASSQSAALMAIESRISKAQALLDDLLFRYTEKHPEVRSLTASIESLSAQRDRQIALENEVVMNSEGESDLGSLELSEHPYMLQLKILENEASANVAALRVRVNETKERIAKLEDLVDRIPEYQSKLKSLNRDYGLTKKKYSALLERYEQVKLSQEVEESANDIKFRILEPPLLPQDPSGPNRPLFISAILVGALVVGIGVAFLLTQLFPTFDEARQLFNRTQVPVFGIVSKIPSTSQVWIGFLGLMAFVGMSILFILTYGLLMVLQLTDYELTDLVKRALSGWL